MFFLFNEINIDTNYEKKREMIDKSNGRTSVPQIFFDDQHIGGYDDLEILDQGNGLEIFQ